LSRYFDVETDIALVCQRSLQLSFELMPKDNPYFNQAIMEFGALQCT
jgi:adenine-specific DNA glycosylase